MKKFKARILSLTLTFMMVFSFAMGMDLMNIYAEVETVTQSVEYDIFDLKVGDILYDGDTVTDSSGVSNIIYCRYGMSAGVTNWENNVCVIEGQPSVISESPLTDEAVASGWEVFDVYDENNYEGKSCRFVQVRASDEKGIYAQLTEPEVSIEKNAEGRYELSIQKETGFTYQYMYMTLGEDLGDGTIVTYDSALEMAAEMLEQEIPKRKTLYKIAYNATGLIDYEEEVEFGEKGALVYIVKYFNDGNIRQPVS